MAYVDKQLTVSDAQAVTATAVSTNAIDTGGSTPLRDVGRGSIMRMIITTSIAATAAGAATVTFELIQADDAALTTNVEVLESTAAIGKATLVIGYTAMNFVLPSNTRRYIGVRYTVATGPLTAGTFTASLVKDVGSQTNYASGYPNAY